MASLTEQKHIKSTLSKISRNLSATITEFQNNLTISISSQNSVQLSSKTSLEQERRKLLQPIKDSLHALTRELEAAKEGGIKSLLKQYTIKRNINKFQNDQKAVMESTIYSESALIEKINKHNSAAERLQKEKDNYTAAVATYTEQLKNCEILQTALTKLHRTMLEDGWVCASCVSYLESIETLLNSAKYSQAAKYASRLVFQKMPPKEQWDKWSIDAQSLLGIAHRDAMAGFIPLTAFETIADRVCELTQPWCNETTRKAASTPIPVDRWHHLVGAMLSPRNLVHPLHWALYWSNFKASQEFASDCMAAAHEDNFSGRFISLVNSCARGWAAPRFGDMGYPTAKALFGTLSLGGLKAEARVGADLGIIIDLDVGDLRVRKVALLQAKKSCKGIADVGSEQTGPAQQTQLQKLGDSSRDFYLFYHYATAHATWPGPTVISATKIKAAVPNLAARNINFDTRSDGWDWASFLAFGLCTPDSGVGRQLTDDEDALSVLGSGDRTSLPQSLLVISISDSDFSLNLKLEIQQHYKEYGTSYKPEKSFNRNTPSLGKF